MLEGSRINSVGASDTVLRDEGRNIRSNIRCSGLGNCSRKRIANSVGKHHLSNTYPPSNPNGIALRCPLEALPGGLRHPEPDPQASGMR